jgi:glycosyltransferase involved in cell wall biosynthesis
MTDSYSCLIRTFNSASTLSDTLLSLSMQTLPPSEYIFVDSGSTDRTLDLLPLGAILHRYVGEHFNYSAALNQGLRYVSNKFVLIISCHTLLRNPIAMEYALSVMKSNSEIGAAYFCNENDGHLRHTLIDRTAFDGFNGLWNTCSLIKTNLLQRRNFRPEVFTAEDQEWARWLIFCENKLTARIAGAEMTRHRHSRAYNVRKRLNEYVAIAYFSNRELMGVRNFGRIISQMVSWNMPLHERIFNLKLLFRLAVCHVKAPRYRSKYF